MSSSYCHPLDSLWFDAVWSTLLWSPCSWRWAWIPYSLHRFQRLISHTSRWQAFLCLYVHRNQGCRLSICLHLPSSSWSNYGKVSPPVSLPATVSLSDLHLFAYQFIRITVIWAIMLAIAGVILPIKDLRSGALVYTRCLFFSIINSIWGTYLAVSTMISCLSWPCPHSLSKTSSHRFCASYDIYQWSKVVEEKKKNKRPSVINYSPLHHTVGIPTLPLLLKQMVMNHPSTITNKMLLLLQTHWKHFKIFSHEKIFYQYQKFQA